MKTRTAALCAWILSLCAAGVGAPRALAQEAAAPPAQASIAELVERHVQPVFDGEKRHRSMVVGVLAGGQDFVRGFGKISRKDPRVPDRDTLYEIGSVTKVFTGLLMGMDVLAGAYREETPLTEILPEGWEIPGYDDKAIRMIDLATHTSALPRMPGNFAPADPRNPYADYTPERLRDFLASFEIKRPIGERFVYSNLAIGLLGYAISQRKNTSYAERLRAEILAPLGMKSTATRLDEEAAKRLARAHFQNGLPAMSWDFGVLAPAGAIRSSMRDMLRFAAAHLDPPEGRLGDAIRAARVQKFAIDKRRGIGHCILTVRPEVLGVDGDLPEGARVLTHSGMTGGYASHFFVLPARELALVMLMNEAKGDEKLGARLLAALAKARASAATKK